MYLLVVVALVSIVVIASELDFFSISVGLEESDGFVENTSMKIVSSDWNLEYMNVNTENVTVADFLFECANHNNFTVKKKYWKGYKSFLIEAINGIENGEGDRYWQYYVNGKFADVGCSNYFLHDNDVVEWRFEPSGWISIS